MNFFMVPSPFFRAKVSHGREGQQHLSNHFKPLAFPTRDACYLYAWPFQRLELNGDSGPDDLFHQFHRQFVVLAGLEQVGSTGVALYWGFALGFAVALGISIGSEVVEWMVRKAR